MLEPFKPKEWGEWLYSTYRLAEQIKSHYQNRPPDIIVAAARGGMIPAVLIAQALNVIDVRLVNIGRKEEERFFLWPHNGRMGKIRDKRILLVEDDVRQGGRTPEFVKTQLLKQGAKEVLVACVYKTWGAPGVDFFIEQVIGIANHPWKSPTGEDRK